MKTDDILTKSFSLEPILSVRVRNIKTDNNDS